MAIYLPTKTDGTQRYSFPILLDGQKFSFDFMWNDRAGFWAFILSDATGEPILRRKVVVGLPLFSRFGDPRLPPGELVALDTTGRDLDPGLQELGARVLLTYLEAADFGSSP